jgi:hypothetical protein
VNASDENIANPFFLETFHTKKATTTIKIVSSPSIVIICIKLSKNGEPID